MQRTSLIAAALIVAGGTSASAAKPADCKKDPKAIQRLGEMGTYLGAQQSFTVRTRTTTDEVLEDGQKVQLGATGTLQVSRPDHLQATLTSDRRDRRFFYDGRTFTIYSPAMSYYTTVDAPPTIGELVERISDRYGIDLPLADLFLWGTPKSNVAALTCATNIGPAKIDGQMTDQYAFRQAGLDWQIWIAQGDKPLPRKLVLTTTDDDARPAHVIELAWTLAPVGDPKVFTFVPPRGSERIEIIALGSK